MITFAVVGHNEASTLARALRQALGARAAGDDVVFVDSASNDRSAAIAKSLDVRVIKAPLGKGRAMQVALDRCATPYLCFLDGDIHGSSENIAQRLAECVREQEVAMAVGQFDEPGDVVLSNTIAVYEPLVANLFPEVVGRYGSKPLTGFRVIDATRSWGSLPPDFGVEAYLNVAAAGFDSARSCVCDIGVYRGRFRYKPTMGIEISRALLDFAERSGRINGDERRAWEAWVEVAVEHIATFRGELDRRPAFRARLLEIAARPVPS